MTTHSHDPRMQHVEEAAQALFNLGTGLPSPRKDFPALLSLLDAARAGAYPKESANRRRMIDGAGFFDPIWEPDPVGFTPARLAWALDAWSDGARAPKDWPHPLRRVSGRGDAPVSLLYAKALSRLAPDFLCWTPDAESHDALTLSLLTSSNGFHVFQNLLPIWQQLAVTEPAVLSSLHRAQDHARVARNSGRTDSVQWALAAAALSDPFPVVPVDIDAAVPLPLDAPPAASFESFPAPYSSVTPDAPAASLDSFAATERRPLQEDPDGAALAMNQRIAALEIMVASQQAEILIMVASLQAALESSRYHFSASIGPSPAPSGPRALSGRGRIGRG